MSPPSSQSRFELLTGIAVLLLVAFSLAGCGSSSEKSDVTTPTGSTANAADDGTVINAVLSEYKIEPNPASASAGDVMLNAENVGKLDHEIVVIKTDKMAGELGEGSKVSEAGSVGEIGDLKPGKSASTAVKLEAGHYALICNIAGHYAAGMYADLNVK